MSNPTSLMRSDTHRIRVLLADDHTLFRQGLRNLLAEADLEVVGEAGNAAEAVQRAATLHADVVIMDVGMPGMSPFEAARAIRQEDAERKVVFLSMYEDEEYLIESMEAGASGYLLKDSPAHYLVTAVREVVRGGSYMSPRMLSRLVDDFRTRGKGGTPVPRLGTLTPREREVLKLIAEGQSVKEVAGGLNVSVKTVEAHKFNLMRKLEIHNKAQLVQYAIQKKVIQLRPAV